MAVTTFKEATLTIQKRIDDNWIYTPIAWDNTDYTPASDTDSFIRVTIQTGDSIQVAVPPQYRNVGVAFIQIFVREKIGIASALNSADLVSALFRNVSESGIIYRAPSVNRGGASDGWFSVTVSIPFQWDKYI